MAKYMMGWVEISHYVNEAPMKRGTERMFLSGSLLKCVAVKLSSRGRWQAQHGTPTAATTQTGLKEPLSGHA
jgi:hypothetical protein